MHYYKRNLGDYAKKAGRLTMLQHGAYTLLIDACYDREVFPTLEKALEWTWASSEAEVEAVKFVLSRFFSLDKEGQYVQDRILQELLQYHTNADINKRIAIERETKRKEKSTNRVPSVNEAPPNHKPLTINQEPSKKATVVACPDGLDVSVWQDWLKIRKSKKAPLTETSWKLFIKECDKAGWTIDAAVKECCLRNWASFKAEWMKEKQTHTERLSTTMSVLTNGLTTPKKPFWQTEETSDVKRIL
jgi:uncharacterized protein YdaU (DUF1376 family)